MATAMLAAPAVAQVAPPSIVTDGNLESVIEAHIVGGDTFPQTNLDNVTANGSITATTTNDGDATGTFENNENIAEAEAFGNRDGVTASQATIGSSVLPDDGIALSSTSLNDDDLAPTGSITSNADNSEIGFAGTDFTNGSVDVSDNSVAATTVINLGSGDFEMSIDGAEPVGYTNLATTNAAVTADLSGATNIADLEGTLLISSVQQAVAGEDSQASAEFNAIEVNIDRTGIGTEEVNGAVTVDNNTIASDFTGNDRTASIAIAADDANSAVTAAISNAQLMDANDVNVSAYTGDNDIAATIYTDLLGTDETTAFVDSSVSVSGNDIAASATGNRANTDVTLADGLAYDTVAGNNATAVIDEYDFDPADKLADVQANAGLVGSNTQLLINGFVEAQAQQNRTAVDVQSLEESSIDLSNNRMLASATGNTVDAAITSGEGSALFDSSAALVSRQEMNNVLIQAESFDNQVRATFGDDNDGTFVNSQVTLDSNVAAASATGNRSRQEISLSATDLALGAGEDGSYFQGDLLAGEEDESVYADGAVVIANAQFNRDADVTASNEDSDFDIDSHDNFDSNAFNTSTAITNGVQQAFATGSDAGNSISLSGVTVGTGAGISNLQESDELSDVTADLNAEMEIDYDDNLISGSALMANNEQSAVARGALASNTLAVDAQTVNSGSIGEDSAGAFFDSEVNFVDAAYAIANTQKIQGDVTAEAFGDNDENYEIFVDWAAENATIELVDNRVLAQAQGVVSTNAMTLDVGSLNSFFGEDDAAVSNLQIVSGSDILANATGDSEYGTQVDIGDGDDAVSSSVANSRNEFVASADSARATNSVIVNATDVSTASLVETGFADAYPTDPYNYVDAMFGVVNSQLGENGSVTSSLRGTNNNGDFFDSAAIYTSVDGNVETSSFASNENLLQALAAGNRAANSLVVSAVTSEDMNSALANGQVNDQDVSALIGYTGTAGVDPFTVDGTVTTGVWNGNISTLSPDQTAAFLATYSGQPAFSYDDETGAVSFGSVGDGFLQLSVGGSDGTRVAGGVLIDVFENITSSSLTVDGNLVQGSAIGNSATNTVSVAVTSIDGNDSRANAESWTERSGSPEAEAAADTTLASTQVVNSNSSSTTDIVSLYGIDAGTDNSVTDAMLSVSNNTQFGEAIGNNVVNSLSVAGTDLTNDATSGALANSQDGDVTVSSNSEMEVFANAVSSASNIIFDGNSNTALAVANNATNVLDASSTNSASSSQADANSWLDDGDTAYANGSFVLVNAQSAEGTLGSTATTNIYNVERLDVDTTGVGSGSVSQSSNSTRAEATSNRASNTMTLGAGANLGSSGALVNQQYSSTATNANAVSNITLAVSDSVGNQAVDASSLVVEGNTTLALARGNSASNTLNYAAGATYTGQAGAALAQTTYVEGDAALLNDQVNTGAISATATGSTSIALNGLDGSAGGSVLNSGVSNSNNSVAAYAYGNSASNTVMLSALNTGMPNVAVGNQQLNTGSVTATATSVSFTMSSVGTVSGASMQNNGNVASAVAVGNSSVTVIGAE